MVSVEKTNESSSEAEAEAAPAYKTKRVQFLGICNVLLLRNGLAPPPNSPEVPHLTLLAAIAEKLLDCNSHIQSKDDGYAINQKRNIGDAIDLLPKLATGIDVNVMFKKTPIQQRRLSKAQGARRTQGAKGPYRPRRKAT